MPGKFQNKYRNDSARAQFWDYSSEGSYFITICSANRACIFGDIINGEMIPSDIGKIVIQEWNKSFEIRAELFCDAFVLMPNHLQAILRIEKMVVVVGTHGSASLQQQQNQKTGIAYRPPKSISSFVAGFKSSATNQINELRNTPKCPVWESRFHDHIIRNIEEYQRIRNYINKNPSKRERDELK